MLGAKPTLLGLVIGLRSRWRSIATIHARIFDEAGANAIRTEFLRADLLPLADAAKLLVLVWGSLYLVAELLAPGSFSINPQIQWQLDGWHLRRTLFNYVSFATMAHVGYNEVTAITPFANTLTWIEVMSAQFYLAVVIAGIVGMKIAQMVGLVTSGAK